MKAAFLIPISKVYGWRGVNGEGYRRLGRLHSVVEGKVNDKRRPELSMKRK